MDSTVRQTVRATFKLVKFSPVGFKVPKYPMTYCMICQSDLLDKCGTCLDNHVDNCSVINVKNGYYHTHCYEYVGEPNKAIRNDKNNN